MADRNETQLINLAAIQRVDPTITNIIDNSTQTALYHFDESSMKWEKTEIEGTFFVYKRSQSPHFGYIILNRLNTTNKVEPVTEISDTNLQVPYLMYQCKSGDIYGIWFYDEEDCVRISKQIARLVHASGMTRNRRQRCVSESDSQTPMKFKNGKSSDTDIIAILANAQMEFNQRNNASTSSLRSVPFLQSDSDYISSSSAEKCLTDKKIQSSVNGNLMKDCNQGANSSTSVTPRKRSLSSGISGQKPSCSKQLFENSSRDLPPSTPGAKPSCSQQVFENSLQDLSSLACTISIQEAHTQFFKSRALSLDSTSKKHIFHEFLGEKHDSDLENNSKLTRLVTSSFTSSDDQIPEEASLPVMTPEMFEHTAVSLSLNEPPCFEKPHESHNLSAFPSCVSWKDQHASGIHQVVLPFQSTRTPLKSVYSPQDFQNSPGDLGNGFLMTNESNCPTENTLSCTDTQTVSKEQLASSLIYLMANDSSLLSKIHEAYISSLKTHLNNFKK